MDSHKFTSVDEYIEKASDEARPYLRHMREIIKKEAPDATEKISYNIPYYDYHGKLIYFAGYTHHVGMYVMDDVRKACADEIKPYNTSKATLQFPIDKPLPIELIVKIVKVQVAANATKKE